MNKREITIRNCNKVFLKDWWRKMMLQFFKIFVENVERKGVYRTFVKGFRVQVELHPPKLCLFLLHCHAPKQ
jgi:hypothetical protein